MIILLVSVALAVVFFLAARKAGERGNFDAGWIGGGFLAGGTAVLMLISILISRADSRDHLIQFQAFRETIERARKDKNLSEMERAAILKEIAIWNEWLATEKYWNQGQFDLWHLDEAAALEPLN